MVTEKYKMTNTTTWQDMARNVVAGKMPLEDFSALLEREVQKAIKKARSEKPVLKA